MSAMMLLLIRQFLLINIISMKQTIKTANYNAVVQIPYERLAKKSNCTPLTDFLPQQNLTQTKTIVVPHHCNGCCQPKPKNNAVTMEMLQQLEAAFDTDMKEKDQKVRSLQAEYDALRLQLTDSKNQVQKYRRNIESDQSKYQNIVKCREDDIKALRKQVQQAQIEKQRILRTKIIEFQNSQLQSHRLEAQKLAKLQAEADKKLKDQILSVNLSFQEERFKLKEEISQLRLSSQYEKAAYERQNERLAKQAGEDELKIERLQKSIAELQKKQTDNLNTISAKQAQYLSLLKQFQQRNIVIQTFEEKTKQQLDTINDLKGKVSQYDISYSELNKKYTEIGNNYNTNLGLSKQYEVQIKDVQSSKLLLLKKIEQLELCIKQKQEALINLQKNGPKVYQVKIQKVIDRSQYIQGLQNELETVKRAHIGLQSRIKELETTIADRNKQLFESLAKSTELERVIQNLRLYIQQKQRSFGWIVEREITKDIQINKNQTNKTYKVYPSEVKRLTDLKQKQVFPQHLIQRIQQNIILEHPVNIAYRVAESFDNGQDSTAILKHLEESGQLKNVIFKEVNGNKYVGDQQIKFQEVYEDLKVQGDDD